MYYYIMDMENCIGLGINKLCICELCRIKKLNDNEVQNFQVS